MILKTVRVTNPRNVLVQIPAYVVANWNLNVDSKLEVQYDETTGKVTVEPMVRGGSRPA